ncbi:PQQ-dependent sugar dehydrogenase [Amycolatopsis cihanbeyliensis]|uniref:Glucose/arabinose dehydrogenase n=1 Tax=Amycolatopsis cihanbeyliensis TaxID=1128664 RepID=A0A542DQB9_AMYCI|nr:PQQ-dependent sugar dehydrogenase [Amycolatopsis cihanbeyliensis]TQJ05292.1 glucose/arabinose dehydrogenase [Amycolatopsis cihanbeyliensis]
MVLVKTRPFVRAFLATVLMIGGLLAVPVAGAPPAAAVPTLPPGFVLRDQPSGQQAGELTDFAYLPDGGGLLSIGKQGTLAWVPPAGQPRTIHELSVVTSGDLGLVGLAVAHDYATSRQIYLSRSVPTDTGSALRLERYRVTGSPDPTGIALERVLIDEPADTNVHGIWGVVAAQDGTLWVSFGDNAGYTGVDPNALRSLDPDALQGKILHLTADGLGVPDNPFYEEADPGSVRSRVFASGFRSPFRLSLDPRTGLPVVGDVGWNRWEEINVVQPGRAYGWPCWEGDVRMGGYADLPGCAGVANTPPLVALPHGTANSITGGIFYSGISYPEQYRGAYFFGDYVRHKLWSLRYDLQGNLTEPPQSPPFGVDIGGPVKFAAATNGDIVLADISTGMLRRLSYVEGNRQPIAKAEVSTDPATRTATFDGSGSYDPDGEMLTYEWDFGDGTTGGGERAAHTYADEPERFTATLTVTDPLGASESTQLPVVPGNYSPVIDLTTPGDVEFAVGEPVELGATATDVEDGSLPVHWSRNVLHCPEEEACHDHPGESADGPEFTVPFTDHPNSRMVLTATATDSDGVSVSRAYTAWPREHLLKLVSNVPAVLQIPVEDGEGGEDPVSSSMITEGATLDVIAAATANDGVSPFTGWTDGEPARSRTLTMGGEDLTLSAHYSTPIEQRYEAEPDLQALLGAPTGPEIVDGDVHYRPYEQGRLYWSAETGVHRVRGDILDRYLALGGHGRFGPPTTDEAATPDGVGRYNHFAGTPSTLAASVYWTPSTGAHGVWGEIRQRWAALGWERGPMGYPVTDENATPDGIGRYNHFSKKSSIYWTDANGAHGIWGSIRQRWAALDWERSPLGYPVTDETTTPDGIGRYNHFSKKGSIYWTAGTGAHEVYGSIRRRWESLGWERSYLGYPASGEYSVSGGRRNDFQHGYIRWYRDTGNVIDRPY